MTKAFLPKNPGSFNNLRNMPKNVFFGNSRKTMWLICTFSLENDRSKGWPISLTRNNDVMARIYVISPDKGQNQQLLWYDYIS